MTWHGGPARDKTVPTTVPTPTCSTHRTIIALLSELLLENTATAMDKAEILQAGDSESPVTAPPRLATQSHTSSLTPHPVRISAGVRTSASPFLLIQRPQSSPPHVILERGDSPGPISDLMPHLHRSAPSIVKTRSGSVLSRGFILKTDHYPSGELPVDSLTPFTNRHTGRALDLDLNIHGAPNFRAPRVGSLNVFGAAQPRSQGLRAILSILRARPMETSPSHVIWISTREEPIGNTVSAPLDSQTFLTSLWAISVHIRTPFRPSGLI
jgi:hypothetical protein